MSLVTDLFRGQGLVSEHIAEWLRARGWRAVTVGRAALWQHQHIARGDLCDITHALIRTAQAEHVEGQSLLGMFDRDGEPQAKPTRRTRKNASPKDDEDLFRG